MGKIHIVDYVDKVNNSQKFFQKFFLRIGVKLKWGVVFLGEIKNPTDEVGRGLVKKSIKLLHHL